MFVSKRALLATATGLVIGLSTVAIAQTPAPKATRSLRKSRPWERAKLL